MKTAWQFVSGIILMPVMYIYFIIICLYALAVLPFKKLSNYVRRLNQISQPINA